MARGPWQDPELIRLLNGHMSTALLDAALELGVIDAIGDATVTVDEVARATSTHEPSLGRVLRALAALEVLTETSPGVFRLDRRGRLLLPHASGSARELAEYLLADWSRDAWPALAEAVRTGRLAAEIVHGSDHDDRVDWSEGSEFCATVGRLMTGHTEAIAPFVVDGYDFTPFTTVVDVGGGSGPLIAAVLAAHPHLRGILLDREEGMTLAPGVLAEAGVADRCELQVGDFFAGLPSGDLYLCKSVLFNWPRDEDVATILAHCRRSIAPDRGRLLLAEQMLPSVVNGTLAPEIYLDDVGGVVDMGARLRTEAEYRRLLDAAGFALAVHPLPGAPDGFSLLEAVPV